MLKLGVQTCLRVLAPVYVKSPVGKVIMEGSVPSLNVQFVRNTGFFNRLTQHQLWKGVLSVSNAGKRRGRGRTSNKRDMRNLNYGKVIGQGKIGVLWPGLNYQILGDSGISEIKKLGAGQTQAAPDVKPQLRKRFDKLSPTERGWSGNQWGGRRMGPPDPTFNETFENFDSIVLNIKMTSTLSSTMGRKRQYYAIVATGNGNGVIGVGISKGLEKTNCVQLAKNRAAKRLLTVHLIDKTMVNHDFFSEYGRTRITVLKRPEGNGLRCQRIIAAICKLVGIENLYAKVEGPKNPKHIIRAFIVGLLKQKTYQEIADENKLHLVEFRKECFDFPNVLASPEQCLTLAEARKSNIHFEEYIMGGRVMYIKDKRVPFYMKLPSWATHLKRTLYQRNHQKVKIELVSKYGSCCSHLTKVYPECVSING